MGKLKWSRAECGECIGLFFLWVVVHLLPWGTLGIHFSPHTYLQQTAFLPQIPSTKGEGLTTAEEIVAVNTVESFSYRKLCSRSSVPFLPLSRRPLRQVRLQGQESVCQICLLTAAGGQRDHKVTSFTFSVASTHAQSRGWPSAWGSGFTRLQLSYCVLTVRNARVEIKL